MLFRNLEILGKLTTRYPRLSYVEKALLLNGAACKDIKYADCSEEAQFWAQYAEDLVSQEQSRLPKLKLPPSLQEDMGLKSAGCGQGKRPLEHPFKLLDYIAQDE